MWSCHAKTDKHETIDHWGNIHTIKTVLNVERPYIREKVSADYEFSNTVLTQHLTCTQ
jgi:hypothetical protein